MDTMMRNAIEVRDSLKRRLVVLEDSLVRLEDAITNAWCLVEELEALDPYASNDDYKYNMHLAEAYDNYEALLHRQNDLREEQDEVLEAWEAAATVARYYLRKNEAQR